MSQPQSVFVVLTGLWADIGSGRSAGSDNAHTHLSLSALKAGTLGQPLKDSPEKRPAIGSAAIDAPEASRQHVERAGDLGLRIGQYDGLTGPYSRTQTFVFEKDPGVIEVGLEESGRHIGQTLVNLSAFGDTLPYSPPRLSDRRSVFGPAP